MVSNQIDSLSQQKSCLCFVPLLVVVRNALGAPTGANAVETPTLASKIDTITFIFSFCKGSDSAMGLLTPFLTIQLCW